MTANKHVIGIDLGTGNSCVATMEGGKPVVIVNSEGQRTTPSIVSFKDGERKVGEAAKRQRVMNVKNTVYNIKRLMGVTYDQAKGQGVVDKVSYDIHSDSNGNPRVGIDGRDYSPEEISAMVLSKMKKTAEDYLGTEVTDAVITCPAWFDDAARQATRNAGTIAGLTVHRVINEPTAAIMASNIDVNTDAVIMVADIGQGTTDFSVCEIADGVVEIKASKGDVFLGGADFDNAVAQWIVDECKADNGADLSKDPMAMQRVLEAAEKAKIELSTTTTTEVNLPYITVADGVPVHFVKSLTRAKMDSMCEGIVKRIVACGVEAMKAADLSYDKLSYILLVGGQSRSLAIQEALKAEFGTELNRSVNPDEAVALGAAIQANVSVGGEGAENAMLLLDVTPLNLGIETMGEVMTKMIEANTTIPTRHTEVFTTAVDNQPSVTIRVLQGCRPMARDNKEIGVFNLDGIMPARRGVPQIEVTFDIDASGILSVTAKDKATGKEQHVTIESKTSITDDDIARMKAEAEEHAEEDRKAEEELARANRAEGLSFSIDRFLETASEKEGALTDEDRVFFEGKRKDVEDMKGRKDYSGLDSLEKEVQERMYGVSARMYGQGSASASEGQPGGQNFKDMFNNMTANNG